LLAATRLYIPGSVSQKKGRVLLPDPILHTATDADLVERAVAGDHSAFAVLVNRYVDDVTRVVSEISGRVADVEDVVQECFIRAYRALRSYRGDAQFRTWLLRIAHNLAITRSRSRVRYRESVTSDEDAVAAFEDPSAPASDESVTQSEERARMIAMVDLLPEHYRVALVLFYYDDMTYEEIAQVVGRPLNTVKAHLHRARLKLRTMILSEHDRDDWGLRNEQ